VAEKCEPDVVSRCSVFVAGIVSVRCGMVLGELVKR